MARSARLRELARRLDAVFDPPAGPWAVALSGGADSAVCAWAAAGRRPDTRALHVHHGLDASDLMAAAATDVAARLGVAVEVIEVKVPPGGSPEGRARSVRYRALTEALAPGEWLLTGHTADDQAETVLLNLLRGSGSDGLAGMPERRPPIVRPLLGVERSLVRELAALTGLPWRDDPANQEMRHLRNRVRRRLLPLIEAEYAAGFSTSLVNLSRVLRAEADLLDRIASSVARHQAEDAVRIAAPDLLTADPAVAARVIRSAFVTLRPPYPLDSDGVRRVMAVAAGRVGGTDLPGGGRARRVGPWLELHAALSPPAPPPPLRLPVPGSGRWGRFTIDCAVQEERPVVPLSPWAVTIPLSTEQLPPIVVRAAHRQDSIRVGEGTKPVFESLAEARVPPDRRPCHPVVEVDGRVVWIPGIRRVGWARTAADRYLVAIAAEESPWAPSEH